MMHEALKRKIMSMKQGNGMLDEKDPSAHPDPAGPAPDLGGLKGDSTDGHEQGENDLLADLQMHEQAAAKDVGQLQMGQGQEMTEQEGSPEMEEILKILADRRGGGSSSLGSRVAMGAKDKMASMMKSKGKY